MELLKDTCRDALGEEGVLGGTKERATVPLLCVGFS